MSIGRLPRQIKNHSRNIPLEANFQETKLQIQSIEREFSNIQLNHPREYK